jgi:hypothetical protein
MLERASRAIGFIEPCLPSPTKTICAADTGTFQSFRAEFAVGRFESAHRRQLHAVDCAARVVTLDPLAVRLTTAAARDKPRTARCMVPLDWAGFF